MSEEVRWIDLESKEALTEGEPLRLEVEGREMVLIKLGEEIFAIEDLCTHDRQPISEGCIEGAEIICPRHGARFCLRTGTALTAPAYEALETFETRVHQGRIQVKIPQ